jgi:hypothetical protein
MLNVIMLSAVMNECRHAECHFADIVPFSASLIFVIKARNLECSTRVGYALFKILDMPGKRSSLFGPHCLGRRKTTSYYIDTYLWFLKTFFIVIGNKIKISCKVCLTQTFQPSLIFSGDKDFNQDGYLPIRKH